MRLAFGKRLLAPLALRQATEVTKNHPLRKRNLNLVCVYSFMKRGRAPVFGEPVPTAIRVWDRQFKGTSGSTSR
jgi:hypothetical protein